jgi:hypothetical protein
MFCESETTHEALVLGRDERISSVYRGDEETLVASGRRGSLAEPHVFWAVRFTVSWEGISKKVDVQSIWDPYCWIEGERCYR